MTCQDVVKITGQRLLFLGVSTINWSLAQFQQAAQFAKAHKIDSLLIKTADGGNRWYGSLAGWQNIKKVVQAQGVGAIPYTYSYGNKFSALDTEIDLLIEYMQDSGVVCADMEQEWNGQVAWAQHLCTRMKPIAGTFLVSTWGNPNDQAWQGVIQALNPCTDSFMPQQYTNYLASCWPQFGASGAACIQPTVMMTGDFGPNDPVAIARAAHSQGHTALSIWYYELAVANPGLLDQIIAAFPATTTSTPSQPAPTPAGSTQPTQEDDVLQLSAVSTWFTGDDTKWVRKDNPNLYIHGDILKFFRSMGSEQALNGMAYIGLPTSLEIRIPNTKRAIKQSFQRVDVVFDPDRELDNPPITGTCYLPHQGSVATSTAPSVDYKTPVSQAISILQKLV